MYSTTIAVGRLTKDPQIKPYSSGNGVLALFSLAVNRTKDKTDFYDCIAFGKTAEMVQSYLATGKGRLILVEGNFQNNNTERDINGTTVKNYGMNLAVNRITFLDAPPKGQEAPHAQQQQQQAAPQGQNPAYGQQSQQQTQQQAPASNYYSKPASQPQAQSTHSPSFQPATPYQAPTQQQQAPQGPSAPDPFTKAPGFSGFDIGEDDLPFN